MPIAKVQLPDGRIAKFEVADGTTPEQVTAFAEQQFTQMSKPKEYSVAPDSAAGKVVGALDKVEATPYIGPVVKGVRDVTKGGAQLLAHGINVVAPGILPDDELKNIDSDVRVSEQKYHDARKAKGEDGVDWGRLGGSILATAPAAGIKAASIPMAIARGAGAGGAIGALNPVTSEGSFANEKTKQILLGGLGGGAGTALTAGLARAIRPNTSPEVKALINAGVTPTPGQILGGGIARFEDKLTSVPVLGDSIKGAQSRALDQFNRAAYNRALNPIGKTADEVAPTVGREGVQGVRMALKDAYGELLPKLKFKADQQFGDDVTKLMDMASNLPEKQAKQFEDVLRTQVFGKMSKAGGMTGETFKGVEEALKKASQGYKTSGDFDQRQLGDALGEVLASMRGTLARSNPMHAPRLAKINEGYANFARIRDAASRVGAQDGVFTAAQLQSAVRAGDKSVGKGNFATGNAFMQDLSEAGKAVLGSKYPDSGTAGRMMAGPGLGAAIGAANPLLVLGLGAGTLPYTAAGQKLMAGLLTKRPEIAEPIAQGLMSSSPLLGTATAGGLLGLFGTSAP